VGDLVVLKIVVCEGKAGIKAVDQASTSGVLYT
jgi:hypothetical protein